METRLEHAIHMIREVGNRVEQEFGSLSQNRLNWKPDADSWSIAECLDHLVVTNNQYFPIFDDVLEGRLKNSVWKKIPGWPKLGSKLVLGSVDPDQPRKMKTFKVFEPSASSYDSGIIKRFADQQHNLADRMAELDTVNLDKTIIASPANKMITYSLADAVSIIWKHEVRHLNQALRVMKMIPSDVA